MTPTRKPKAESLSVPQQPQSTPMQMGMPGHDFTLQAVMELQKSFGRIEEKLEAVRGSVESTKSKVDDLVKWKHMIIGGVMVLGIIIGALWTLAAKFSDHFVYRPPTQAAPATQDATTARSTEQKPLKQ